MDLGACFCGVFVVLATVLISFSLDYFMFFDDLWLSFSLLLLTDMVLLFFYFSGGTLTFFVDDFLDLLKSSISTVILSKRVVGKLIPPSLGVVTIPAIGAFFRPDSLYLDTKTPLSLGVLKLRV